MVLVAHANAALAAGTALRLPAHPAFLVVRRVRCLQGERVGGVDDWFAVARSQGCSLRLAGVGVAGEDVVLSSAASGWRITGADGPLVIEAAPASVLTPMAVEAATACLRAAATEALATATDGAPATWSSTVGRAVDILDSAGTGEELSDVAWPHFLLPTDHPPPQRRLAAAAATLWLWEGPGAWSGPAADAAHAGLREPVGAALTTAVAAAPGLTRRGGVR